MIPSFGPILDLAGSGFDIYLASEGMRIQGQAVKESFKQKRLYLQALRKHNKHGWDKIKGVVAAHLDYLARLRRREHVKGMPTMDPTAMAMGNNSRAVGVAAALMGGAIALGGFLKP